MLLLKVFVDHYDEDSYDLRHSETSLAELIREAQPWELVQCNVARLDPKQPPAYMSAADKKKFPKILDASTINLLKSRGWVHLESVEDRETRKKYENKYYIVRNDGFRSFYEFDPDDVSLSNLEDIANGGVVVQGIDPNSILKEADRKNLAKRIASKKEQQKKAAAKKKLSAEAKKKKQIEKAKKILEAAGETLNPVDKTKNWAKDCGDYKA